MTEALDEDLERRMSPSFDQWMARLWSFRDVTIVVATVTALSLVFGVLYSRYYFNRLGFPYQFMDLGTSFFMIRSLTPLGLSICFATTMSGGLVVGPLLEIALASRRIPDRDPYGTICLVAIIFGPVVCTGLLGFALLKIAGYGYLINADMKSSQVLIGATFIGYMAVAFCSIGYVAVRAFAKRKLRRRFASLFLVAAAVVAVMVAAYAGLITGRIEAVALVQGESRNSILVDFDYDSGATRKEEELMLVMIYDHTYYMTPMLKEAPRYPAVFAYPESELSNVEFHHPGG